MPKCKLFTSDLGRSQFTAQLCKIEKKLEKWPKTAAVLRRVDPSGHHMFAICRDSYPGRCDIEFKVLHNVLNGCNFKHVFKAIQILLNPQCYWRWFVGFKNGSCNSPSMEKLPAQFQFHTLLAFPPTTPGPTYRLEYLLSRLQPCSCFYMLAFPWNCFPVSDLNQVNALLEVLEKKSVRGPFNDDQWYFDVLWIHCFSCKLATVLIRKKLPLEPQHPLEATRQDSDQTTKC